jgi:peptidoglycan/LPS O-acetylase OafA/YrhL
VKYRPEIDGLRALAVLPVMLFHAGLEGFSGGFVGVDVFFVISGYLITTILVEETAQGRLDLAGFYERRARRILPALLLVTALCVPAAWLILSPRDLERFARSVLAVATFSSNVLFWIEAGYFDTASEMKPLLHTWSLAVEEQFYVLFPLLLLAVHRLRASALVPVLTVLALASLAWANAIVADHPDAAFFLLPARGWELLVGALCALRLRRGAPLRRGADAVAFAGLAAITAAIVTFDAHTPHPGVLTLLPVLGTAAIVLAATGETLVGRLLAHRFPVTIGLASYSAYLWHQPLFAFVRYGQLEEPPAAVMLSLVVVALLLAHGTRVAVEDPLRRRRTGSRRAVLGASVLASGAVVGLGLLALYSEPVRPHAAVDLADDAGDGVTWQERPAPADPAFVLYGDSHARQYFRSLEQRLGPGALIAHAACLSLPGLTNVNDRAPEPRDDCVELHEMLEGFVARTRPPTLVIAQRWPKRIFDTSLARTVGDFGADDDAVDDLVLARLEAFLERFPPSLRIIVIGNVPGAWPAGPAMVDGWTRCHGYRGAHCPRAYPRERREGVRVNAALAALAERLGNVDFVDPADVLCEADRCHVVEDGTLLYSDHAHLTTPAAQRVVRSIRLP